MHKVCHSKKGSNRFIFYLVRKYFGLNNSILYDSENDYYNILNINENSDIKEIKKSFFSLSMKLHPDKGGDENDFKKINTAYEVLKDEDDKRIYDRLRKEYQADIDNKINKQSTRRKNRESKAHTEDERKNYNTNENSEFRTSYSQKNNNYYSDSHYYSDARDREEYDYRTRNDFNQENSQHNYNYWEDLFEILKEYRKYANKTNNSTQASQFDKFKVNLRYTPTRNIYYEDFKISNTNRHHMNNRMKYYQRFKLINYVKFGYNPFAIHNNMDEDKYYLDSLRISNQLDDEDLNKKISLRDLIRVYSSRKSLIIFITLFYFIIIFNSNFKMLL